MPRLKLELPTRFQFSTEIPVRISDINYSGHLGNDAVLSLIHEARVRFLKSLGYAELDIEGVGIIMSDALVIFKSEGFYGDTLTVEVAVTDVERSNFDFIYRLTNKSTGKEVARVKTGIVFFDYQKKRIAEMPKRFSQLVSRTW